MAEKFVIKKGKAKTGEKKTKGEAQVKKPVLIKPEEVKKEVIKFPPAKLKICIIGPGAIGGLVAAYLRNTLRNVFVVGNPEQIRAINMNGLRVESAKGTVYLAVDAKEKLNQKVDLIILAVKTQDIKAAIDKNKEFMQDTLILTIQNGVRAEKLLQTVFGEKNIISSIVMFGSTCLKPGVITHNFEGNWIMGRPFFANDDKVKEVAEELGYAFKTVVVDDIMPMKWTKLFVNLNNCIPAFLGKSMQESFSNLDMAKLSILLLKEAFDVVDRASVKLINLPDFDLLKFRSLTQMPLDEAAKIFSGIMVNLSKEPLYGSILQSIKRDKPSEIDYINGEIVQLCRLNYGSANLNFRAVNLVHQVEKRKRFFTEGELKKEFEL